MYTKLLLRLMEEDTPLAIKIWFFSQNHHTQCTALRNCSVVYCTVGLERRTTCNTPNVVYHILCPCQGGGGGGGGGGGDGLQGVDYVGSATNMKHRWSKHKSDIRKGVWTACGLTKHFCQCHQGDMEEAIITLQVTLLDHLTGHFSEGRLHSLEQDWMERLGTYQRTGLNTRRELLATNRKNWGNS